MITRNNYEEFFLLYVDHELSAADRQMVESFVADHPDLGAELDLLAQCRFDPAREGFPDKSALLKPAVTGESLLLYIDGELDGEARRMVETRAQEDAAIQRELSLLRQTISEPDGSILFAQKEALYRREGERRIFYLPAFRVAAAALLLLLTGLAVFFLMRKKEGPLTAGASGGRNSRSAHSPQAVPRSTAPGAEYAGKNNHADVTRGPSLALYPSMKEPQPAGGMRGGRRDERRDGMQGVRAPGTEAVKAATPVAKEPVMETAVMETAADAKRIDNSHMALARIETGPSGHPLAVTGMATGMTKGGTFATDALREQGSAYSLHRDDPDHADMATSGDDGDKGDDEDAAPARKRRLRGVFRTVSRVFEKTTSQADDDRHGILIGNLQIALK
ncbi:MAG: hypothetical protein Q8943_05940 [Bacteroidota bacterium]|nr:hypothetical protein [Bacteroidota bacterium]